MKILNSIVLGGVAIAPGDGQGVVGTRVGPLELPVYYDYPSQSNHYTLSTSKG